MDTYQGNCLFLFQTCYNTISRFVLFHLTGQTDLLDFQSMGLSEDGYINNVNLALTDVSTNSPVYYVTVKAINRAGKESAVMSSR